MTTKRSHYGPGHAQVKHHEWRTAENSTAYLISPLQSMAKTNPHLKLLDVGAGSGTITASLAKYIPEGELVGTDISSDILEQARKHAESVGVHNIKFEKADIHELPFPDATFDVTHAHQVLCHLATPVEAIQEMLRVTKPGGIVAIRESDMNMWCIWPELPELQHYHDITKKVLESNGGQTKGGRQLLSWVLQNGVAHEDVDLTFATWCFSKPEDKKVWGTCLIMNNRF